MIHEISIEITLCDSNIILSINLDIEVLLCFFFFFSDVSSSDWVIHGFWFSLGSNLGSFI